jgi:hypothetical protein
MFLTGSRSRAIFAGLSLCLITLSTLLGCASPTVVSSLSRPDVYRSDERILHRLKPGETPEMLAKTYLGEARLAWMVEDANPKAAFLPDRFVVIPLVIKNRRRHHRPGIPDGSNLVLSPVRPILRFAPVHAHGHL